MYDVGMSATAIPRDVGLSPLTISRFRRVLTDNSNNHIKQDHILVNNMSLKVCQY